MTPIFDERSRLEGQPGLHALIAGVSAYPYFEEGNEKSADNNFELEQLSSAALTAYKIYCWLLDRQKHLPIPLATCRLLLSPSPDEIDKIILEPELRRRVLPCKRKYFAAEAKAWRTDAYSHQDNITLFYFVGHGIDRGGNKPVLLLEDFGDPNEGLLSHAADMNNLYYGMARPASMKKKIAGTQLYFIDACRNFPRELRELADPSVPDIFNPMRPQSNNPDTRQAPIFYAAAPGHIAHSLRGEQTIFSKVLLKCLNGGAGECMDEDGQGQWYVSINTLNQALVKYFSNPTWIENVAQRLGPPPLEPEDKVIHYLDRVPIVDILLEVNPDHACSFVKVVVLDERGQGWKVPEPLHPHPFHCQWPAGYYTISAKIDPPNPHFIDRPGRTRRVWPPRYERKIGVAVEQALL